MNDLGSVPVTANCSMLFTDVPVLDRPGAAKTAGFDVIEFWWPFADAVPGDKIVNAFVAAVADAGAWLAGLNLFGCDLAADDCGALSVPSLSGKVPRQYRRGCRARPAARGCRLQRPVQADQVMAIVNQARQAGMNSVGFLCDPYHPAANGTPHPRHGQKAFCVYPPCSGSWLPGNAVNRALENWTSRHTSEERRRRDPTARRPRP